MAGPKKWLEKLVAGVALATTLVSFGAVEAKPKQNKTSNTKIAKESRKRHEKPGPYDKFELTQEEIETHKINHTLSLIDEEKSLQLVNKILVAQVLKARDPKTFHTSSMHLNGQDKSLPAALLNLKDGAQTVNSTVNSLSKIWVKRYPFMTNYTPGTKEDLVKEGLKPEAERNARQLAAIEKGDDLTRQVDQEKAGRQRHLEILSAIWSVDKSPEPQATAKGEPPPKPSGKALGADSETNKGPKTNPAPRRPPPGPYSAS